MLPIISSRATAWSTVGHVSIRHPERPGCFLISRSMAPALVSEGDLQEIDFNGRSEADDRPSFLERFIHVELYHARPDIGAVVHSHSPAVIPFGTVPKSLFDPSST